MSRVITSSNAVRKEMKEDGKFPGPESGKRRKLKGGQLLLGSVPD